MKFDAIVIGSATLDFFVSSLSSKIINENSFINKKGIAFPLGQKIDGNIFETKLGGSCLNAATTFSNFGYKTHIISTVGKDNNKKIIHDYIKSLKNNKKTTLKIDTKKITDFSCIILSNNAERTIIKNPKGCSQNLKINQKDLKNSQAKLIFSSSLYGKKNNWNTLLNYKKANPKTLWCSNPNKQDLIFLRNNLNFLKYIDCFFLNLEEASILSNLDYRKEKEIFQFIDNYIPGICIISKGSRGLVASDGKCIYTCDIYHHIKLVDTTGSGDALASGFSLMYQKTKDIEYSLKFALANAGNNIEKIGGTTNLLTPTIFNNRVWKKHFNKLKIKKEKIC